MIRSMTGFARAESTKGKTGWSVEIRSLNHRYFEFSLKTPSSLYGLEDRIRELCQTRVKRGKVSVSISEAIDSVLSEASLDEKVLGFYLSATRKIQRRFGLKGSLTVNDLLTLPRIFSQEKKTADPDKLWPTLKAPLEKALERLLQARIREGKTLSKDILERIDKIEKGLSHIEKRTKNLPEENYEKLRLKIQDLLKGNTAEDQRIWQEVAFLAERSDITEEVVRLKSHLQLFREKVLKQDEAGKELDFLLQEMNREVNTTGAKGQDFGISKETVAIKAELEKIREQVQNIE